VKSKALKSKPIQSTEKNKRKKKAYISSSKNKYSDMN